MGVAMLICWTIPWSMVVLLWAAAGWRIEGRAQVPARFGLGLLLATVAGEILVTGIGSFDLFFPGDAELLWIAIFGVGLGLRGLGIWALLVALILFAADAPDEELAHEVDLAVDPNGDQDGWTG